MRFPFGYGLSYTRFVYRDLHVDTGKNGELLVKVRLANVGDRAGDEIVQIYAGCPHSSVHRPVRVLVGFARVSLKPGEERQVEISVPRDRLAFYDPTQHRFVVEAGQYEICAGASSRDLPLRKAVLVSGEAVMPLYAQSADGPYGAFSDNRFSDAAFYGVHSRPPQNNALPHPGEYDRNTPLRQMNESKLARMLASAARVMTRKTLHFSPHAQVNQKGCTCNGGRSAFPEHSAQCLVPVERKAGRAGAGSLQPVQYEMKKGRRTAPSFFISYREPFSQDLRAVRHSIRESSRFHTWPEATLRACRLRIPNPACSWPGPRERFAHRQSGLHSGCFGKMMACSFSGCMQTPPCAYCAHRSFE